MIRNAAKLLVLSALFSVIGCAFDVIRVDQIATTLDDTQPCDNSFVLAQTVEIKLDTGYNRTLKKGTAWNCIGNTVQGDVYRTKDQILTIEASNVFEAYVVVSSKQLVGFYLPVERTFSPLNEPLHLVFEKSPKTLVTTP